MCAGTWKGVIFEDCTCNCFSEKSDPSTVNDQQSESQVTNSSEQPPTRHEPREDVEEWTRQYLERLKNQKALHSHQWEDVKPEKSSKQYNSNASEEFKKLPSPKVRRCQQTIPLCQDAAYRARILQNAKAKAYEEIERYLSYLRDLEKLKLEQEQILRQTDIGIILKMLQTWSDQTQFVYSLCSRYTKFCPSVNFTDSYECATYAFSTRIAGIVNACKEIATTNDASACAQGILYSFPNGVVSFLACMSGEAQDAVIKGQNKVKKLAENLKRVTTGVKVAQDYRGLNEWITLKVELETNVLKLNSLIQKQRATVAAKKNELLNVEDVERAVLNGCRACSGNSFHPPIPVHGEFSSQDRPAPGTPDGQKPILQQFESIQDCKNAEDEAACADQFLQ